jgi:excinuclease ABC subunit A
MAADAIRLRGVRVHNLKNVDVDIPVNSLTVITGPSGSGKSSLAFDTLYAEGRRRFVQSLSSYARQFLEKLDRPEADVIESIFPSIAIQQKNQIVGSRSTVGTITEVYDYLRLLFARIGKVRCPECRVLVKKDTVEDVANFMEKQEGGQKVWICFEAEGKLSPQDYLKKGFIRAIKSKSAFEELKLEGISRKTSRGMMIVVDRLKTGREIRSRVVEATEAAFREGHGRMAVLVGDSWTAFDSEFRCSSCLKTFTKPEPQLFSFNNALGACPRCRGFGDVIDINFRAIIPDPSRSIEAGAIEPWRKSTRTRERRALFDFCDEMGIPMDLPWEKLTEEHQEMIKEGHKRYKGVRGFFNKLERKKYKMHVRVLLSRYRGYYQCPDCNGSRLRHDALLVKIGKFSIGHVASWPLGRVLDWLKRIKMTEQESQVVARVMEELKGRLQLLVKLGINYLSMNRRAQTLSGGEVQRINLANALGGSLIGTLFVLDEPTIGLHERDTARLISILKSIRDLGNTVVVVEHDSKVMKEADYIIDLGPQAGQLGGEIMFAGTYKEFLKKGDSTTAKFLRGEREIPLVKLRRKSSGKVLKVEGASEHNLKNISVEFPLGGICCVTGVSGSGKSTLVHDVLYSNMMASRGEWDKKIGSCISFSGLEHLDKIEMVDQGPIGRSPRSNPVTYMKAFSEIRNLFADRYQSRIRGYKPSSFSFNVRGGRCETCQGNGVTSIEMQFLPDVHITCEDCRGTRYKREILDIKYKNMNIHDVLQLSVSEALDVFRDFPALTRKLSVLEEVGLGYLQLGQPATTLSGGEGQRIKLAFHMSRTDVSNSLFIFDEPTTGLHFSDIRKLLDALRRLVFHGASVLVIEHNMDVIKNADWIIDLGPEGGDKGGWVVATGTPEEVADREGSYTGKYLQEMLGER